jgi:glutaredoxin 3
MFTIYSRPNCPYCDAAKALLKRKGLEFIEIQVNADTLAEFSEKTSGARTVPQVFYYEKLIGGYDALSTLAEEWWNDIKEKDE